LSLHNDRYDEWGLGGGLAPHIGVGREFTPHISLELNTVYAFAPGDTDDPLINVMLLVTALAY
jgi:hypothetical protein